VPSEFVDEVLRINDRYLHEVVEGFDVCPFARGARTGGALRRRVLIEAAPELGAVADEVVAMGRDPEAVIGLVIFPRFAGGPDAFDRFVAELRTADTSRVFAMATFHPDGTYGTDTPQRMVMFFRRSPDPTIQLVRFSALDDVKGVAGKFLFEHNARGWAELEKRASTVPLSDRIARDNHATAMREGLARFEAIYADIRADRDRSYARFG
jgi:hypothetical protein